MLNKKKTVSFFESEKARKRLDEYLKSEDCYPLDVVLHLNTTCNHKCDFCYNILNLQTSGKGTYYLDSDYAVRIIDKLSAYEIDKLIISGGGEPLLHKDIKRIIETTVKQNFSTFLYTNIDSNITDLMDLLNKLDGLNVNINTSNKELYRTTRGKNANFHRMKRNLEALSKEKQNISATVIIRDNTIQGLEETIYWLAGLEIKQINISPAFDLNYSDNIGTSQKSLERMGRIKEKIHDTNVRILEPEGESVKEGNGRVYCKSHYFDITIGADYGVYPCCATSYLKENKIVDLKNYTTFHEAWTSEERYKWIKQSEIKCKTCWFSPVNKILLELDRK